MANSILLAEDEEFIRDLYKRQLTQAGFAVDAVANGDDAVASVKNHVYDLILLDIMMPGMDGIEALKQIKKEQNAANTKIILLTNLGQDSVIKEAFENGATGYLIKLSIDPYQLVTEVKNYLATDQNT